MPDVVVIGGGVIGCATAYFLARDGAKVTLLERGEIASQSSGAAAGMLAALSHEEGEKGPAFEKLCAESLAVFDDLLPVLGKTGVDVRYHKTGVLHVALNEAEAVSLQTRYKSQRRLHPDHAWLEGAEVQREEPGVNPRAVGALLTASESYVDPRRLTEAFAAAAKAEGATILTNTPATRLIGKAGHLDAARTPTATLKADAFVVAGGAWTTDLARKLQAYVPVRPVRGQMVSLDGPKEPLRHLVWGANAYLVPREDGQTFVGATVEEVGFRARNTSAGRNILRRGAGRLIPELAGAKLRREWFGFRPKAPDGLPVMGQVPGWSNVWVSTGHFRNGILLAPISGSLIASSLLAGKSDPRLLPFAADRFKD